MLFGANVLGVQCIALYAVEMIRPCVRMCVRAFCAVGAFARYACRLVAYVNSLIIHIEIFYYYCQFMKVIH